MQFDKDMESENRLLFLQAREELLRVSGISETKKSRITTYSDAGGGICHMRTMPHGIDIGFLKGAKFEDEFGLLTGNGKVMRVLPLGRMNKSIIRYYVRQAIALNRDTRR